MVLGKINFVCYIWFWAKQILCVCYCFVLYGFGQNKFCVSVSVCLTKILFHALPHCKANSTLQLDSINTNNSTPVEHNSKTLTQNKFDTRPKFYLLSRQHFFALGVSLAVSFATPSISSCYASLLYR